MYVAVGMITGFVISVMKRGIYAGSRHSAVGIIIPVGILFILFIAKAIGGGDIKLLSAAGSFIGTDVGFIIIYSFVAGGILSFIYLIRLLMKSVTSRNKNSNQNNGEALDIHCICKAKIHFSLAILLGTVCYLWLKM